MASSRNSVDWMKSRLAPEVEDNRSYIADGYPPRHASLTESIRPHPAGLSPHLNLDNDSLRL